MNSFKKYVSRNLTARSLRSNREEDLPTRKLLIIAVAALFSIAFSFTPQSSVRSAAAQGATHETQTVYTTPDGFLLGDPVPGAYSTLVRNRNGLTTSVHTFVESGPGPYTLWWIIFNDPASCATYLCTFDLPDLAVNATGKMVPPRGVANFSAWVGPGGPYSGEVIIGDPGLTNPEGALITLVVRYHGPAIPGIIPQQLTYHSADFCPGGGAPCVDEQIVVFPGECSGACLDPSTLP